MLSPRKFLGRKQPASELADVASAQSPQGGDLGVNMPMLLILGSLEAEHRKDVLAYARGLVEGQVIAKDACFVDAIKHNGRWIFEVHEGGAGLSLAGWVVQEFAKDPSIRLSMPLTADRTAVISQVDQELVTIIYPPNEDKHREALQQALAITPGKLLAPYYGSAASLRTAAASIFGVSALAFLLSGSLWFVRANAIDVERFAAKFSSANSSLRTTTENLPSFQLSKATKSLNSQGGYLSYLKLEKGKWSWATATAAAADLRDMQKGGSSD